MRLGSKKRTDKQVEERVKDGERLVKSEGREERRAKKGIRHNKRNDSLMVSKTPRAGASHSNFPQASPVREYCGWI